MKIKKLLIAATAVMMFAGCTSVGTSSAKTEKENEKLKIVTTIYPQYDWIKEILGEQAENVELTLLMNNGGDLHSYQPTASDIAKIAEADLFVYVGGESDEWVKDALEEKTNDDMKVIDLLETLGDRAVAEEEKEGMQESEHAHDHEGHEESHDHEDHDHKEHAHDEDHDHEGHTHDEEHEHDHDHHMDIEYDEHIWLSLRNAQQLIQVISKDIMVLDPSHEKDYEANTKAYLEKLSMLDASYQATVDASAQKTLIFGDRFPFRYMVEDYGLDYFAAFVGCSAETEASFETVAFLAKKVDDLGIKHVLTIETSDQKIAKTIIENTNDKNQNILTLDSLQSVSQKEIDNGISYYEVMQNNLKVLANSLDTEVK